MEPDELYDFSEFCDECDDEEFPDDEPDVDELTEHEDFEQCDEYFE